MLHRFFKVLTLCYGIMVLPGIGAARMIRDLEAGQNRGGTDTSTSSDHESEPHPASNRAKIFAISGLATNEDKVRAIVAGMDG